MDIGSITAWTGKMCEIGFNNDCEFDGWGTNPDQGEFTIEEGLNSQQYYDQGIELVEKGLLRKAEAYLTKSIELEKRVPLPFYSRGHLRAATGRRVEWAHT